VQTIRIEESSTAVAYAGTWDQGNTARNWSGGTAALGFVEGQRATVSFGGTGVSWVGFQAPFAGIANVYLDGTLVKTVDLYAAAETVQAVLFTASGLASAPHTLTIEATRTKNTASADYIVVVDAFDVTGTFSDTTSPTVTITTPGPGDSVWRGPGDGERHGQHGSGRRAVPRGRRAGRHRKTRCRRIRSIGIRRLSPMGRTR
jgi:hypothetical protein